MKFIPFAVFVIIWASVSSQSRFRRPPPARQPVEQLVEPSFDDKPDEAATDDDEENEDNDDSTDSTDNQMEEKPVKTEGAPSTDAPESSAGSQTERPIEDQPRGPIAVQEALEEKYAATFTPDAENKIPWQEPETIGNCWMQAMLSNKYDFTPQCNQDGSFAAKQCYLERCWCSNRNGTPMVHGDKRRFYYEIGGLTLRCLQNGIPV